MTNQLIPTAKEIAPTGDYTSLGLNQDRIPTDTTLEEAIELLKKSTRLRAASNWAIGDIAVYCEKFGEDVWNHLSPDIVSLDTYKIAKRTAQMFVWNDQVNERKHNFPFSTYAELSRVQDYDKRMELAQEAEDNGWTQKQAREMVAPHTKEGIEKGEGEFVRKACDSFANKMSQICEKIDEWIERDIFTIDHARIILTALRHLDRQLMRYYPKVEDGMPEDLKGVELDRASQVISGSLEDQDETPEPDLKYDEDGVISEEGAGEDEDEDDDDVAEDLRPQVVGKIPNPNAASFTP